MKGTKVQTLGVRAVAGVCMVHGWCMAGCLGHKNFSLFSRHISRTQSFQQNRHVIFPALVALNLLVSLISRLVACSARTVADKQTDRQTDRQTHRTTTVTLAAHAPRVNYVQCMTMYSRRERQYCFFNSFQRSTYQWSFNNTSELLVSSFYRKCQPKISFGRESRNSAIVNYVQCMTMYSKRERQYCFFNSFQPDIKLWTA